MRYDNIKKIVTTVPARLGDTIFCLPAIRLLKTIFKDAMIDVITLTQLSADVFENNPNVSKVFVAPKGEALKKLQNKYDLAVDFGDAMESFGYINYFNAEKIFCLKDCEEKIPQAQKMLNFVANYFECDLNKFDAYYDFYPSLKNKQNIVQLLNFSSVSSDDVVYVGFHLGCHGLSKKRKRFFGKYVHPKAWPLKNFIRFAKFIKKENQKIKIVLTGAHAEKDMAACFCKKIPDTINLIDKTTVLDLCALMHHLKLFVCNDTGALHVACATPVNLLALFGSENEKVTGPFQEKENRMVLKNNKISKLSVKVVMGAAMNLLNK